MNTRLFGGQRNGQLIVGWMTFQVRAQRGGQYRPRSKEKNSVPDLPRTNNVNLADVEHYHISFSIQVHDFSQFAHGVYFSYIQTRSSLVPKVFFLKFGTRYRS